MKPRGTAGFQCVLPVRSAQPGLLQMTPEHVWSRSTVTPPTKGAASLGAAEMGQAMRRELLLGLRSAEPGRDTWP